MKMPRVLLPLRQSTQATVCSYCVHCSSLLNRTNSSKVENDTVSISIWELVIFLNLSSAHKMIPVKPSPPIVAANSSEFWLGEQTSCSPVERTNSSRST